MPKRRFWDGAAPHLSRSYATHFQGITANDLEDRFNYLAWDLSRRSRIPEAEPRLPRRRFSWQESWILYCWGLGMPLFAGKLPETLGDGVSWKGFAALLNSSPTFPESISVDDLKYDVQIIMNILEGSDINSVSVISG